MESLLHLKLKKKQAQYVIDCVFADQVFQAKLQVGHETSPVNKQEDWISANLLSTQSRIFRLPNARERELRKSLEAIC